MRRRRKASPFELVVATRNAQKLLTFMILLSCIASLLLPIILHFQHSTNGQEKAALPSGPLSGPLGFLRFGRNKQRQSAATVTSSRWSRRWNGSRVASPLSFGGASVVETTGWDDEFLVLRNVCLLEEDEGDDSFELPERKLVFFPCGQEAGDCDDSTLGSKFSGGNPEAESWRVGIRAMEEFASKRIFYTTWEADLPDFNCQSCRPFENVTVENAYAPKYLQGQDYRFTSMMDWLEFTLLRRRDKANGNAHHEQGANIRPARHLVRGTASLAAPHHPDNNFHIFNNFIIPTLNDALKSDTNATRRDTNRTLFVLQGNRERFEKRVITYELLHKIFKGGVVWPFERYLRHGAAGVLCFQRLIWAQDQAPWPYYTHDGRFGSRSRWKGLVPKLRDWINAEHNVIPNADVVSEAETQSFLSSLFSIWNGRDKPFLLYMPRDRESCPRCIRNEKKLIGGLSYNFVVHFIIHREEADKNEQLLETLKDLSRTNVLLGVHGAALGYTMFLQPGSILCEIREDVMQHKLLFRNMASLQNIPYYAYDVGDQLRDDGIVLLDSSIQDISNGLRKAVEKERWLISSGESSQSIEEEKSGQCEFPLYEHLSKRSNRLSTFEESRCYLQQNSKKVWNQCTEDNCSF